MTAEKRDLPNIFREFDNKRVAELLLEVSVGNNFGYGARWCKGAIEDLLNEAAKRLTPTEGTSGNPT